MNFINLLSQGEIVVKVGEESQIEAALPVIEVHNSIFLAERQKLSELTANNGVNAGIILPEMDYQNTTKQLFNDAKLTLFVNGLDIGTSGLWPNDNRPEASVY